MSWDQVVLVLYLCDLLILSAFGVHRAWLVWMYHRHRGGMETPPAPPTWPRVTVQLPVFNERDVVVRLIETCSELDYPRDRLQIQVLDDSTDDTTEFSRAAVDRLCEQGIDAEWLHRVDRTGFKAGALQAGLASATGEFIAVFDADFVPQRSFLRSTVPWFSEGIGMVQARWGHLNAEESWLTEAQATLLDGHFVVEHAVRHRSGRWFNFNGTAGIWRRTAITAAGGWQHDTLTEDLDLSYRAQLQGWRFIYLDGLVVPAELPATMSAFKTQQHRWAKGSVQTARKLIARIWRSPISTWIKVEASVHLLANFAYPLVLLLALAMPIAVIARGRGDLSPLLVVDLVLFLAATGSMIVFYGTSVSYSGWGSRARRIAQIPIVMALGLGMAVSQTRAVFGALWGPVGSFVRTPKRGAGTWSYSSRVHGLVVVEVALSLYLCAALAVFLNAGYLASAPFLALFGLGFAWVGLASLRESVS